jgi:hypothetical protein
MKSLIKRICLKLNGGIVPIWYLHNEQSLAGVIENWIAKVYEWTLT